MSLGSGVHWGVLIYLSDCHDFYSPDFVEKHGVHPVHEGGPEIPECVEEEWFGAIEAETVVEEYLVVVDDQTASGLHEATAIKSPLM